MSGGFFLIIHSPHSPPALLSGSNRFSADAHGRSGWTPGSSASSHGFWCPSLLHGAVDCGLGAMILTIPLSFSSYLVCVLDLWSAGEVL